MSLAYHCDNEDCDTWMPTDTDLPNAFVAIVDTTTGEPIAHCCNQHCLMLWAAANSTPTETVPL